MCVLSLLLISLLRLKLTRQSVAISYDVLLGKLRSIYPRSKGKNVKEGRIVTEARIYNMFNLENNKKIEIKRFTESKIIFDP
ncbi:MAG: hypothetical protein ACTSRZ_19660 [Promethearchaeota archaeon]